MSKCKTLAIVAPACLWLAVSGGAWAGPDGRAGPPGLCEELGQVVRLLESPSFGLKKTSSDLSDANAGIDEISGTFAKRFTAMEAGLRFLAERSRPFDLSIVVDEQACASEATQCRCLASPGPSAGSSQGPNAGSGWKNLSGLGTERTVESASALNSSPVAVNIFVSRNGMPVSGLSPGAFRFSLALAPLAGPTVLSGCGTESFQEAGNGVYQIWLWPQGVNWATGTYVGRLDTTDDDGFTVNSLIPIRIL